MLFISGELHPGNTRVSPKGATLDGGSSVGLKTLTVQGCGFWVWEGKALFEGFSTSDSQHMPISTLELVIIPPQKILQSGLVQFKASSPKPRTLRASLLHPDGFRV